MHLLQANDPLLVVGCGHMGSSLVAGLLRAGMRAERIGLVEPNPSATVADFAARGCQLHESLASEPIEAGMVLLAIKPQLMPVVLPLLGPLLAPDVLLLSIAAGTTLATLKAGLGGHACLVRAMPNLPATIGLGVSACYATDIVDSTKRAAVEALLSTVGQVLWLEREEQLNIVTALSGSGPAYLFYLIECLESAGAGLGLPADIARQLAIATVYGTGALAHQSTASPTDLRQQVTSPGGTTEAALDVLMPTLAPLIRQTLTAASKRAEELAK